MKVSTLTLAPAVALAIVTAVWADQAINRPSEPDAARAQAPVPIRWMPHWLQTPVKKAIADASDPRDRKPKR